MKNIVLLPLVSFFFTFGTINNSKKVKSTDKKVEKIVKVEKKK